MASRKYTESKLLLLTKEQAKTLSELAKANGVNESVHLRSLIGQKPKDYPEIRIGLANLITEINHIGHNINQIVYNNNSWIYSEADKRQLVAYMRKVNNMLMEMMKGKGENNN